MIAGRAGVCSATVPGYRLPVTGGSPGAVESVVTSASARRAWCARHDGRTTAPTGPCAVRRARARRTIVGGMGERPTPRWVDVPKSVPAGDVFASPAAAVAYGTNGTADTDETDAAADAADP